MKSSPFISVVINNYNYARFLPDAINSVLNQKDYSDYEVIVVDDVSTDHSRELIASYGNKIIPIYHEVNSGQGEAFNTGVFASRGEWICFLDADDIFAPDKLANVAKKAKQHPDATLIYHRGYCINKDNEQLSVIFPQKICRDRNFRKQILSTSESLLPPTSFLTFNRQFLNQVLPLDPFLARIDADFPLQILAGLLGKIVSIRQSLGFYRLHGSNWFTNEDFLKLSLETLHQLTRRTEKTFYYINKKLQKAGLNDQIDLLRHRFHRRNLFIFNHLSWWKYLSYPIFHPNFEGWKDKWNYLKFGIQKRRLFIEKNT